jgi:hypothetical protein
MDTNRCGLQLGALTCLSDGIGATSVQATGYEPAATATITVSGGLFARVASS